MSYIKDPKGIEVRSFEIITEGLGNKADHFAENEKPIVPNNPHVIFNFNFLYNKKNIKIVPNKCTNKTVYL